MKSILVIATLTITSFLFSQVKSDTLRNETIIKMTKSKLGDKIILSKINTSPVKFDISTDGLINLKSNNVSDTVLNLMVYKQSLIDENLNLNANNNSDGSNYTFKSSGIYFKKDDKYITLDPTLVSSSSAGGIYAGGKIMSQIEGEEANYQFDSTPEFYFNFSPVKKDLNKSNSNSNSTNNNNYIDAIMNSMGANSGNSTAISPNEFRLVQLREGKGKREYQSGKVSSLGKMDNSIGDNYIVNFKYEKISEFTFKIIFPEDLEPGQYCFVYLSNSGQNVYANKNTIKAFDFGIKKVKK